MRPQFTTCLVLMLAFGANCLHAQTVNGGFESPGDVYPYRVFSVGNSLPGWVVEHGTVEITAGRYWAAAEGKQSLDLNGIFEEIGTIYQDVPTQTGQRYRVRFAFAGNPEGGYPKMKSFRVSWNDQEVTTLSFDTTGTSLTNMGWRYHEFVLAASGSKSRLRFQSLTPTFCGPTLDDVTVTPVDGITPTFREQLQQTMAAAPRHVQAGVVSTTISASPANEARVASVATNATLQIQIHPVLTLFGTIGSEYRIESTQDLSASEWQTVTNLTLVESPQLWIDMRPANVSQRFYRAVATGR